MSNPNRVLPWMASFLACVAVLAFIVRERLTDIFVANPFFNGVILFVLAVGVLVNLRQVFGLNREVAWVDWARRSGSLRFPAKRPRLLAQVARVVDGREGKLANLSAQTLRTLLDSVQLRLEESRDLSRYLTGLAIFLGLLGTFWGLLVTIRSVSDIIGALNVGGDAANTFANLKDNLREPLGGMSTSFSTSLFGLASSLIIGFLDLQASHAQNRFYNELEEWLTTLTHHAIGSVIEGETTVPSYVQALLEQTADELERMQRAVVGIERTRRDSTQQLDDLVVQFERFNELLDRDIRERQASSAAQDELKTALRQIASHSRHELGLSDDLRAEFRLLSRTISAALNGQQVRA
jgi:hypothetical protein